MKSTIKTQLEASIRDNAKFIKAYSDDGNIKAYYASNMEQNPNEYYWYLTDEEAELYDSNIDSRGELMDPVWDLLEEYNMPIDKYFGEIIEPAY